MLFCPFCRCVLGFTADHLTACANWPWFIRDDAPMLDVIGAAVTLNVRYNDVLVFVNVDPHASAAEVTQQVHAAVSAGIGEHSPAEEKPKIILKV